MTHAPNTGSRSSNRTSSTIVYRSSIQSYATTRKPSREKVAAVSALISAGAAALLLVVVLVLCIILYRRLRKTHASNHRRPASDGTSNAQGDSNGQFDISNPGYDVVFRRQHDIQDSDSDSDLDDSSATPRPQPVIHYDSHPRYHRDFANTPIDSSGKLEHIALTGRHVNAEQGTIDNSDGEVLAAFWQPGNTLDELLAQIERKQFRRLLLSQVKIDNKVIGDGEFGTVKTGTLKTSEKNVNVAVKVAKSNCSTDDKIRFMREAAIMSQFKHENIVYLYGTVLQGNQLMLVMEMMYHGDLKSYLRSLRQIIDENTERNCVKMCRDIACGMEYLSRKAFVHRDLAARNVLMDTNKTCKIGDFGLARDLISNSYYFARGGRFPIRWTALEAACRSKYSTASDVWSYGIVLYEIWSLGERPYGTEWSNDYVILRLDSGYRLPPPPGCSRPMYKLMIDCWHPDHHKRPTFENIVEIFDKGDMCSLSHNDSGKNNKPESLGDPLESTQGKYSDLQTVYRSNTLMKQNDQ